jgi:hypothetical protein
MTVADVAEDDVVDAARVESVFVEFQKSGELIIRHGHVRADLFLFVLRDELVY